MISFEPSSSIFKSIPPSNFSQRKPIVIFCNYNTSLSPARNSHCDLSTAARSYSVRFSYDERRIRSKIRLAARNNGGREQMSDVLETERDVLAREVHCEVEVISWRERRIKGEIHVNADAESVWNALTDYERLADFVPNLVFSGRIPCPHPGRIWLEQRGLQRALYWHIEARVVLDLQESVNSSYDRELHFSMVDGDFKKFEGKWSVKSSRRKSSTLSYEVSVIPRFNFPAIFLERIIQSDLPVNLRALASRAECKSEVDPKMGLNTESTLVKTSEVSYSDGGHADKLVPTEPNNKSLSGSSIGKVAQISEANDTWGVFGNVCKLERPRMVDEIHLRRFDGLVEDGGVHRSVTASITIKAPVHEVWKVLTAYESLPEIVPNLAISKILSRDNNRVRILQEGCKGLLYMVLHARVVLDLCEQLEREIRFEQVEGDFDSFHGKWQLEQLGNHHTMLKYSVESKMRRDTFLSEALMEEVIYEDLPSNLCAIRDSIEKLIGSKNDLIGSDEADANTLNPVSETGMDSCSNPTNPVVKPGTTKGTFRQRPRVPGLQRDFEVLKSELRAFIIEYGQEGFMPMRKQLRLHGRVDIEKAINRKGGFRKVASLMNLSLAYKQRKPKGYWDNLENLEDEIGRFQKNWGMDPSYMPSRKSFERAGRYDIARALEKWGGLHEVSRLLSFKVRHPNKQYSITKEKRTSDDTDSSGNTVAEDKGTSKSPYVSQDTQKWMSKLKQLDINCPF